MRCFFLLATALTLLPAARTPAAISPADSPRVMIHFPDHLSDENRLFQGIPGLDAANGRHWAVWYGGGEGEDENNVVMAATSGDGGETWSGVRLMIDTPAPVRCFDPVVWTDPQGRLWIFWAQAVSHGIDAKTWAMVTENPGDEHPVWQKPFPIGPGVMMNKPTVNAAGEWLLPISDWEGRRLRTPGAATAGTVISRDGGKTFESLGSVYVPVEHRQYDEHMFVQRGDGSLWMGVRTRYGIGEAVSRDGGKTWSELNPSPVQHLVSRFFIRRLQSGNLVLVKHGEIDERPAKRSHLMAFVSQDDGETWRGGLLLDEREGVSYPDGFQDPEGRIHIIYDFSRRGHREILTARFTEEAVLRNDPDHPGTRLRQLVNKATGQRPLQALDLEENRDGEPVRTGAAAAWQSEEGEIAQLEAGTRLFSDRQYSLPELPDTLKGSRFLRGPLGETRATATRGGLVWVLTPSDGRNRHSLHDDLTAEGFEKARIPEFLLFEHSNRPANVCSVYQKTVETGETVSLGTWGVLVIPPEP